MKLVNAVSNYKSENISKENQNDWWRTGPMTAIHFEPCLSDAVSNQSSLRVVTTRSPLIRMDENCDDISTGGSSKEPIPGFRTFAD
jgi:hypothetical protein